MYHSYKKKNEQKEIRVLLSFEKFQKEFVKPYQQQKPIRVKGKYIPFEEIDEVKITTTLLKNDEIQLFGLKNNFIWNENKKDFNSFIDKCLDETEDYLPHPFEDNDEKKLNDETGILLKDYPKALKLYRNAINHYKKGGLERNVLDDLRLCLELLLKNLFKNNKPLEKQMSAIGTFQQNQGAAKEITNMFHSILKCYAKYQNENVKHNDNVNEKDMNLIIDFTRGIINYLLKE